MPENNDNVIKLAKSSGCEAVAEAGDVKAPETKGVTVVMSVCFMETVASGVSIEKQPSQPEQSGYIQKNLRKEKPAPGAVSPETIANAKATERGLPKSRL